MDITHSIVKKDGTHLINIGMHVEFWKYGKYCIAFEDGEYLDGFLHNDRNDWQLIERAIVFYSQSVSSERIMH